LIDGRDERLDVRYWHKADSLSGLVVRLLLGVKRTLPVTAQRLRGRGQQTPGGAFLLLGFQGPICIGVPPTFPKNLGVFGVRRIGRSHLANMLINQYLSRVEAQSPIHSEQD